jgi:hypothetical protein
MAASSRPEVLELENNFPQLLADMRAQQTTLAKYILGLQASSA